MRTAKVRSSYTGLLDNQLAVLAGKIVDAMTDNQHFDTINPPLAELAAWTADYRQKQQIAYNGGSAYDRKAKKDSRKRLLKALRTLAYHVNTVADGDVPVLVSTGMILTKEPTSVGVPEVTENVRLGDGELSGQIRVDFDPQKIANEYEIQIGRLETDTGVVIWDDAYHRTTKSRRNILEPVIPGRWYYVRVRARNGKGIGDWTEPVSIIAR